MALMRGGEGWAFWRRVLGAVPPGAVARAVVRRALDPPHFERPRAASSAEVTEAVAGLEGRPRLFPFDEADLRALYETALPGELGRLRAQAEAILRGELVLFGVPLAPGAALDWHLDPTSGRRFDPGAPSGEMELLAPGMDPKWPWELGRGAHLLVLGTAARLVPELRDAAARAVVATIASFLAHNPVGRGVHWTVPLEAALRAHHWLAALELVGDDGPPSFRRQLGAALVEHGRFIAANLEDRGIVSANHLVGNLVGLLAIATAVGSAAEAPAWRRLALLGLRREAARQILDDGADFEASTAYHRFALELFLSADRLARAARLPLDLEAPLGRMFRFVAGYLGPDGCEPAFGDGDDGRVLPLAEYPARYHGYLLPIGAVRTGAAALKRPGLPFSVEAAWLEGWPGWKRWAALAEHSAPLSSCFRQGGVHVLRGARVQVVLRAGGYGQLGMGGHAHNDQLSVAVWWDGAPLIVDPGTLCYAADPTWRNHLRGTAAHATVTVEGAEQSPLPGHRLFSLPDAARARVVASRDEGDLGYLRARHEGYRRLRCQAVHERELRLDRRRGLLGIVDQITGRGEAAVTARFPVGDLEVRRAAPAPLAGALARLGEAPGFSDLGSPRPEHAVIVWREGRPWVAFVPLGDTPEATVRSAWWAPRYGVRRPARVVCFERRTILPILYRIVLVPLEDGA